VEHRIVVCANPPFLVVHTNAAYCRLSGIESHAVIGKPISNLLSIPDLETLAEVTQDHQQEKSEGPPDLESATYRLLENLNSNQEGSDNLFQTEFRETQGLTAAEAAGQARAAASQTDSVERLIATSGLGRWSIINLNAKSLLGQEVAIAKPSGTEQPSRGRVEDSNTSSIASNPEGSYRRVACKFPHNTILRVYESIDTASSQHCLRFIGTMGVSPVVSSPEAFAVITDKDQESHHHKSKRRKHHQGDSPDQMSPHQQQPRRSFLHREISIHRKRHLITHYVIQLEPFDGDSRKLNSLASQSSTSTTVKAQMLGVTKSELRLERGRGLAESATQVAGNEPVQEESDDGVMDSESSNPHEAVTAVG
jgi:hypothetical protein